ncbi:MAG: hypothetical protein CM15mP104_2540 [Gammaproteobacteria bacterium]|nr:MAG: hypothetical protein CM15mP104_2540 [Gammaproteobacteria bacterium]
MLKNNTCSNAHFDHNFLAQAFRRNGYSNLPFHPFLVIDTVHWVLYILVKLFPAKICKELKIEYDNELAHSAAYDAEITQKYFVRYLIILN